MVQWLRIHLPMQGTRVRALVREDPTCCRATKPMTPQLLSLRSRAREPQLLKPAYLEPVLRNKRSHRHEKPAHRNEEQPPLTITRESLCAATKTQHGQKKFKKKKKKKKTNKKIKVCWIEDSPQFNPRAAIATSSQGSGRSIEYPCLCLKPAWRPLCAVLRRD